MATNLAPTEILVQTLDAFKERVPMLFNGSMSTTFTDQRARKDQVLRGHIRSLPTVGDYGADGYFSNATDGQTLLTDVDVTLDQHKHVTINLTHLKAISDDKRNTDISDSAYVLGKSIVDAALAKVLTANITTEGIFSVANSDFDMLNQARKNLVSQGANVDALYGIVNSDVAETLNADTRIASKDYFGQESTNSAISKLYGVSGFQEICEYPSMPANAENLTAVFFDPRCMVVTTALPDDSTDIAQQLGVPTIADTFTVTDPETGLSFLGILHMKPGLLDLYMTITVLYGTKVGGAELEAGGYRIVTA